MGKQLAEGGVALSLQEVTEMFVFRRLVGIRVSDAETVFWKHCESPFTQALHPTNHVMLRFVQSGFLIIR